MDRGESSLQTELDRNHLGCYCRANDCGDKVPGTLEYTRD